MAKVPRRYTVERSVANADPHCILARTTNELQKKEQDFHLTPVFKFV